MAERRAVEELLRKLLGGRRGLYGGATIGMAIAIALAGIVAGMAIDDLWHRRREREEDCGR
jgi:hypothetical protein